MVAATVTNSFQKSSSEYVGGSHPAIGRHLLCGAVKDEQPAANRNQVFSDCGDDVWYVSFGDDKMASVISGKGSDNRAGRGKQC